MIDFTSFGKLIPDSLQLPYSSPTASILIGHYILKYNSILNLAVSINDYQKAWDIVDNGLLGHKYPQPM